jgi:outer membrane protein TolC
VRKDAAGQLSAAIALGVLSCFGTRLAISKTRWMAMLLHITGIVCAVMVQSVGKRSRFCWIALAGCALLSACNDTRDLAPATPTSPWQYELSPEVAAPSSAIVGPPRFTVPPNTAVQFPSPADIDPNHVYSLVELIDIAQCRNPATRVAWEEARQAAIKVGIERAAYLPALTARAVASNERIVIPLPPAGWVPGNFAEVVPELGVSYLLLDFGGRRATVEAARQRSFAANVTFTAAHQLLIFNVARTYFTLGGANATVRAARQTLADAQVVQQSAAALRARGLATVVDVDIARRGIAQAQYDLAQSVAVQHDAMYSLLSAMDLPPTKRLRVADASARPLPPRIDRTVDEVLNEALYRRPDLLAGVAKLRATDAEIAAARSELLPKLSLNARVDGFFADLKLNNIPPFSTQQPREAVTLNLSWPLYDGGLLRNKLRLAKSQREAAADELQGRTDQALRDVALAYDQIDTGLRQYKAAIALQTASETAFRSARDTYAQGLGTFTDAVTAQTGLASARAVVARAHAQSLINAAALAFAMGLLTSSADFDPTR